MKVADFALQHNVEKNAVFQYIRRHADEFEGHTGIENKSMVIDDVAVELLSKKYPMPVEVVQDTEAREELRIAMERIDILQQRIDIYQQQIIELLQKTTAVDTQQFLLEDRNKQIEELKETGERYAREAQETKIALRIAEEKILQAEDKAMTAENKAQRVENKIQKLQRSGLWARIRNTDV